MISDIQQGSLHEQVNQTQAVWAPSRAAVPSSRCWAAGWGGGVPPHLEGAQSHRSNGEARGALLAGAGGEPGVPVLHPTQGGKWEPREQNRQAEKGGKGAEFHQGSLHLSSGKIQGNLTGKQPRQLPRMGQGTCVGRRNAALNRVRSNYTLQTHLYSCITFWRHIYTCNYF